MGDNVSPQKEIQNEVIQLVCGQRTSSWFYCFCLSSFNLSLCLDSSLLSVFFCFELKLWNTVAFLLNFYLIDSKVIKHFITSPTSLLYTPFTDTQYLLQVDVLIDDSLVPLGVETLACVFWPPLVFSTVGNTWQHEVRDRPMIDTLVRHQGERAEGNNTSKWGTTWQ